MAEMGHINKNKGNLTYFLLQDKNLVLMYSWKNFLSSSTLFVLYYPYFSMYGVLKCIFVIPYA